MKFFKSLKIKGRLNCGDKSETINSFEGIVKINSSSGKIIINSQEDIQTDTFYRIFVENKYVKKNSVILLSKSTIQKNGDYFNDFNVYVNNISNKSFEILYNIYNIAPGDEPSIQKPFYISYLIC
jgi:hypothetical protein